MSLCRRCALNGIEIEGGDLGVCSQHKKTKCQVCGLASLGEQLCTTHAHQAELARWTAKANLRIIDPADEFDMSEIRREKLQQAKFLAHESVEIFFRAMHSAVQAIWGREIPAKKEPRIEPKRKAA